MKLFTFLLCLSLSQFAFSAETDLNGEMYNGTSLEKVNFVDTIQQIPRGSVVFLGELHGFAPIQRGQLAVLNQLRASGHKVHVGMEFLDFTQQKVVDNFRSGAITEPDFLKLVNWGSINFDFYRNQILFPNAQWGEQTFGINCPRWVTGEVSKKGLAGISEAAQKLLPPHFQLGRDSYKKRFTAMMAEHVPPDAIQRYFEAQSVWDESMAWKIGELPVSLSDTIVVVVGQFHVEFGGGLPYQYQERYKNRPVVIIQEALLSEGKENPINNLKPTPEDGPRADYLLIMNQ